MIHRAWPAPQRAGRPRPFYPSNYMFALMIEPILGAIGFSLIYLLIGGGLGGAVLIFIVLKMFKK